jgi:multisubunit Na+/H+ antiporter MnhB subunit
MKWGAVFAIVIIAILMTLFEWPKINQNQKKEKAAFMIVTGIGCLLAILLIIYPEMPGPTQLVESIYKPLGKLLEK